MLSLGFTQKRRTGPTSRKIFPANTVWATPEKPDGYLREFILLGLVKRITDKLGNGLIDASSLEHGPTSNRALDENVEMGVQGRMRDHLGRERDLKEDNVDEEESGEVMEQDALVREEGEATIII